MERYKNCHIGERNFLILRDGELFHRKYGIGFYSPRLFDKYKQLAEVLPEPRIIWLKNETESLFGNIQEKDDSFLIEGALGQGKSALIYGLRSMARNIGVPYCYLDGHFLTTPPKKL